MVGIEPTIMGLQSIALYPLGYIVINWTGRIWTRDNRVRICRATRYTTAQELGKQDSNLPDGVKVRCATATLLPNILLKMNVAPRIWTGKPFYRLLTFQIRGVPITFIAQQTVHIGFEPIRQKRHASFRNWCFTIKLMYHERWVRDSNPDADTCRQLQFSRLMQCHSANSP